VEPPGLTASCIKTITLCANGLSSSPPTRGICF
jgi:hypothetical protein